MSSGAHIIDLIFKEEIDLKRTISLVLVFVMMFATSAVATPELDENLLNEATLNEKLLEIGEQ
ncbi:hypothetical protein SAMN02745912_02938 [Paramaledivibacter caminithermalis DSM 15212]|jgi:hypothetical protein|uniref:Uncharacterized protein n=1 Tax=Paramaledivibacter caminithermalis (strain DSM 15212 / CIP 107654 / DViRD3) TaxID=1121301 RepID=A0A1M6RED9_PARC5|nr:hypothetical protein SAMN02745912_02938 [Paramaledivibacter caminithermalis DSM 15212]